MNAVMIMCHKNIDQVLRLVRTCKSSETVIILHIDKKYNLDPEQLEQLAQIDRVFPQAKEKKPLHCHVPKATPNIRQGLSKIRTWVLNPTE